MIFLYKQCFITRLGKQLSTMCGKVKILLVESETPLAMMLVASLAQAGCDVQVARTGEKGMELAFEQRFDVIILDADSPTVNAMEICSELKQRHISYQTPIVFIRSRATIEDQQRAFELGAADFIEKPFDVKDFISRVLSQLEESTLA